MTTTWNQLSDASKRNRIWDRYKLQLAAIDLEIAKSPSLECCRKKWISDAVKKRNHHLKHMTPWVD